MLWERLVERFDLVGRRSELVLLMRRGANWVKREGKTLSAGKNVPVLVRNRMREVKECHSFKGREKKMRGTVGGGPCRPSEEEHFVLIILEQQEGISTGPGRKQTDK